MRISSVNTINNVAFKSGKVNVYSDFDNTYYPFLKQGEIKNNPANVRPDLVSYFDNFKTFLDNTKENLSFHITTGRTYGEFETIAFQLKEAGYKMPLPKSLIVKNGSDEHLKLSADEDFYNGQKFPFSYSEINKQKENEIKKVTNWDGSKIRENLINVLKSQNLEILECDTENSIKDYGEKSLYSKISNSKDWVADIRKDGNLKIHLSLPSDCDLVTNKENGNVYKDIKSGAIQIFENGLNDGKVKYFQKEFVDKKRGRKVLEFSPNMQALFESLSNEKNNNALSKLYDTRKAVAEAKKNDDLVIVAGDSSNDYDMLNPAMYIDYPKGFNPNSDFAKPTDADFIEKLTMANDEDLKKMNISQKDKKNMLAQMSAIPLVGIVVKKNEGLNKEFEKLVSTYGETSQYKKIIEIEEGHLEDGIKKAIKQYASSNEKYAKVLKKDIKNEIDFNLNNAKKFAKNKLILPIIMACGIVSSLFVTKMRKTEVSEKFLNKTI
ncbi:MAG: hypothetical protein MJ229_00560 [bacterium]|nr:hypothetical protein [bacterium]